MAIAIVSATPGDLLAPLAEACGEVAPVERWTPRALPGWLAPIDGVRQWCQDHDGARVPSTGTPGQRSSM
jgi:hypothetical protein